jgi:hypothetical protein
MAWCRRLDLNRVRLVAYDDEAAAFVYFVGNSGD